jgi:hypothetical protein
VQSTANRTRRNIWCRFPNDIFSNNMDANYYIQILENNLLPLLENSNIKLIFQHDNDPKHKSKKQNSF